MTAHSPKIILGDNPIFGVNHRSRKTGDAAAKRFEDPKAVLRLFREAQEAGASGVMLSSHERSGAILKLVRADAALRHSFKIYPNIPYLLKYVQQSTQKGLLPMIRQNLLNPSLGLKTLPIAARGLWALSRGRSRKLLEAGLDLELLPYRGTAVRTVFLHNGIVDLALGLGLTEVLRTFDAWAQKRGFEPAFGTLNFSLLAKTLDEADLKNRAVMTPFNPLGFHMNPSRAAAEDALKHFTAVPYAMNVLASGSVKPAEAFDYLKKLPRIRHILIGTTRPANLRECANHLLSTQP